MPAEIRLLRPGDTHVLGQVAAGVFDDPIDPAALTRFLSAPHHHLAAAVEDGIVVGFISALHIEHPDKVRPELWVNEIGVTPTHRERGIGRALLLAMLAHGKGLGCDEAWVLTDRSNGAAMALYAACGGDAPSDHVIITFRLDGDGQSG